MRKLFEIGGLVAAVILIAFGITSIVMGFNGRDTVHKGLAQEYIVGSPDMTPTAIKAEAKQAGLPVDGLTFPSLAVAGKKIDTGDEARAFAGYMRIHALEATGGLTYAQMGRYTAKPGTPAKYTDGQGGTSDEKYALIDPKSKQPVSNGRRDVWIQQIALGGALNTSYMAERISAFGIVMGVALLLAGIGFAVLSLGGALEGSKLAFGLRRKREATGGVAAKA